MKIKWLSIILLMGALTGCVSTYHPLNGSGGGYSDQQLSSTQYKVTYDADFPDSYEKVHNYLLYRCAQIALENNYPYFIILHEESSYQDTTQVTTNTVNGVTYPIVTTSRYYALTAVMKLLDTNVAQKNVVDSQSVTKPSPVGASILYVAALIVASIPD
ncbi:MAG: hypothetical protein K5Q00_02855 [Gammaproteobacteria bacterium]|nr:hypothetical protein [Gammaproteobacteria bacterium]